jgi:hypothetical protein
MHGYCRCEPYRLGLLLLLLRVLLAQLLEQLLEQLHLVEHDLADRGLALVVTKHEVFLRGLSGGQRLLEGQVTDQLIVFVIDTHLLLRVVPDLLVVQVVLSSCDFTESAGRDALLAGTTGFTVDR